MSAALIIGDSSDPHVAAVHAVAGGRAEVAVLNSEGLADLQWRWTTGGFEIDTDAGWRRCTRAWQRRLSPAGAHRGVELGTRRAAESSARLALIIALADSGIEWLSDHWSIVRAENKLVMHRVAQELGIRSPMTVVVGDPADIPEALGEKVAVKPLGVGDFVSNGLAHAVHTRIVERTDPDLGGLAVAPFIVQQPITARSHLRVVTVEQHAWTCCLDAGGLPVDWRAAPEAHHGWRQVQHDDAEADACGLGKALGLGYSSQDWIVDDSGRTWLVDVNPAGQWLFLPDPVASEVTDAIATWLVRNEAGSSR